MAKKLILIGLDGAMPEHILRFSGEGKLPFMTKMMREGSFAEALPVSPADTPTNWATIVTGSWTGTHGITSFRVHFPGEPLDKTHDNTFDSGMCQSEFFWDAAEREGKRSVIINYPVAWPPTVKRGVVVGGSGVTGSPDWRIDSEALFVTKGVYSESRIRTEIQFVEANGWKNIPKSHSKPLESVIPIAGGLDIRWFGESTIIEERETNESSVRSTYNLLLIDSNCDGYDKLFICQGKDAAQPVANLSPGRFSHWIYEKFLQPEPVEGAFRFKLTEISPDAKRFGLHRSAIGKTEGWAYPKKTCKEIVENIGPFITGLELQAYPIFRSGLPHMEETWFEYMEYQSNYLADVAKFLTQRYEWDMLIVQIHIQDAFNHTYCRDIYPRAPGYDSKGAEKAWKAFEQSYQIVDKMIGKIIGECANEETLVAVVSDHGGVPVWRWFWVGGLLTKAGLLHFKRDPETGRFVVDWNKTKAIPGPIRYYIWVNLKGRDPNGIVELGEEYEKVRDEVIKVLYEAVDPETGQHPIAVALRKEDAEALGQWGNRIGDIVYYLSLGYDTGFGLVRRCLIDPSENPASISPYFQAGRRGSHNNNLPSTSYGVGSNRAVFLISGPGVRRGYRRATPICLVDVAPTLAHLSGSPMPRQSEGRILFDMLEE